MSGYKLVVFNLYSFLCYLLEFFSVHRFVIGIILPYKENRYLKRTHKMKNKTVHKVKPVQLHGTEVFFCDLGISKF